MNGKSVRSLRRFYLSFAVPVSLQGESDVADIRLHNRESGDFVNRDSKGRFEAGSNGRAARVLLLHRSVKDKLSNLATSKEHAGVDMVDLLEDMLFQRASSGIRPMLYLSSHTDLECSMMILLDETGEGQWSIEQQPLAREIGYHIVTN